MFRWSNPLKLCGGALAVLLAATAAMAESGFAAPGGPASAALNFRIVIPPVMQVLENSHPRALVADGSGTLTGQQRLVVLSNMKRGFCVSLRTAESQRAGWRLQQTSDIGGVSLQPAQDGYRLCATRPGRYTLQLQHAFDATASSAPVWPVQTDLITL